MWQSLSISQKIWFSLSILIIGYFFSMLFGYTNGKETEKRIFNVSEYRFSATQFSQGALTTFNEQLKFYKDAIITGDTVMLEDAQSKTNEVIDHLQSIEALNDLQKDFKQTARQLAIQIKQNNQAAQTIYSNLITGEYIDTKKVSQLNASNQALKKELETLTQNIVSDLKSELNSISQDTQLQSKYNMTAFFVVLGCAIFIIGLIISRSITRPLRHTVEMLNEIKLGDLSVRLPTGRDEIGKMGSALNEVVASLDHKTQMATSIAMGDLTKDIQIASSKDSLGDALKTMLDSLNSVILELNDSAAQVDNESKQIAESSIALSQGATEQASTIQQITSTITEIDDQTKTNAQNANLANQLAQAAHEAVRNGMEQTEEMVLSMNAISESSNEIGKILKAIDDIAFQTNLLALNAAVEAARAGKHGKGFAVVAQEVRALAARSAKAAQETSELIGTSIKKIEDGNLMAEKTAQALQKINEDVTKVTNLVSEIAIASTEQARGIAQVNEGLVQVGNVTQQNTANAEETSSAAGILATRATHVHHLLSNFQLKNNLQVIETPENESSETDLDHEQDETSANKNFETIQNWGQPEDFSQKS